MDKKKLISKIEKAKISLVKNSIARTFTTVKKLLEEAQKNGFPTVDLENQNILIEAQFNDIKKYERINVMDYESILIKSIAKLESQF